jgi:hypothetical protein
MTSHGQDNPAESVHKAYKYKTISQSNRRKSKGYLQKITKIEQ